MSYRSDVLIIFFQALFEDKIVLGISGIEVDYFTLIVVEIMLLIVTAYLLYKKKNHSLGHVYLYSISFGTMMVVYVFGMCVLYMFKFSEYEALKLASLDRYLGTVFLAAAILVLGLIWNLLFDSNRNINKICGCVFLGILLMFSPIDEFLNVFNGTNIEEAFGVREGPSYLTKKILTICDGNDKICLINQNGTGQENLIVKFEARPNIIIAKNEADLLEMPIDQLKKELVLGFDYLAIYRYDDEFVNRFSGLFADPDDISIHGLYMVDKESGILYPVAEEIY